MEIKIENLVKKYKDKIALSDINLTLPQGSFTAILGPSGCGKTTLMRCLAGFLTVERGTIRFGDQDVTSTPPQNRGTAMVFQNYALWPHMTVFDNIAYGLKIRRLSKQEIERKVYAITEKVEIETSDIKKRRPTEYSGGQQQRIALARSLVLEPKLLLMDEPLSNLDAKVRQRLRVEIRSLQKDLGITAVYVTHDQDEAMSMADQIVLMRNGIVEQVGTPKELYNQPANYFVSHFLGNSNTLNLVFRDGRFHLGKQTIPLQTVSTEGNGSHYALVFRSEEGTLSHEPSVDPNMLSMRANLRESLFVGSGYRHWLQVEGQSLFIESTEIEMNPGQCYIHLPLNKSFVFPQEEAGE
jgi:ABC-type Fe3+/spermidine/putrescine transport system ATPase subunit